MTVSHPLETVGLCVSPRTDYRGLESPYHPPERYPELALLPTGEQHTAPANDVYTAVRDALFLLGLDAAHAGTAEWNPLGELVQPGGTVVIKPNMVRHYNGNPAGSLESVLTHGSVLRPLIDYALRALEFRGRIVVADAPQHDGDISVIHQYAGREAIEKHYQDHYGFTVEFLDLRQEWVIYQDGIIVERFPLPGDPAGYSLVDLGGASEFADPKVNHRRLRGSEYDAEETVAHHSGDSHQYLLCNTVVKADLVINVPKIKTHKKAGVTLALKNLFGINGNKNLLPHHSFGFPHQGGDEFPAPSAYRRVRSQLVEWSRPILKHGRLVRFFRAARRAERSMMTLDPTRSGNWHGNDTIWRTIVDLNKAFFSTNRQGKLQDAPTRDRAYLVVLDGILAGEGNGPMEPDDRPAGVICAGLDPIAADLTVIRLMGFDWRKVKKVARSLALTRFRFTRVGGEQDVRVNVQYADGGRRSVPLSELDLDLRFRPHVGWIGNLERETDDPVRQPAGMGGH